LLLGNDLVGRFSLGLDSGLHLGSNLDVGGISVHLVAKGLLSLILALQRGLDIVIEWGIEWVVNSLSLLSLLVWVGVSGLVTLIAVESWVRFQMDISLSTGKLEVSILGWHDPFSIIILIWVPLVAERLLNLLGVCLRSLDVVINSEVGNWVVHWVSLQFWVLVLGASSRRADWVIFHVQVSRHSQGLLGCWLLFSGQSVVGWHRANDLSLLVSWKSPSSLFSFLVLQVLERVFDVVILAEVRNLVVNWVIILFLWVWASGAWANWITLLLRWSILWLLSKSFLILLLW